MGNNSSTKSSVAAAAPVIKRQYVNKNNTIIYTKQRIVQNFILIWLDTYVDETADDCKYTISQLRQIVNSITIFKNSNDCQKFIKETKNVQIFLIVSGTLGKTFVPINHDNVQIDAIYIFCGKPSAHTEWTQSWKKIKCVSDQIESICHTLVNDVEQCEQDLIPTSILPFNDSLNQELKQIEPSFMYSQLLKEILLEMNYDQEALHILVDFCRVNYKNNKKELEIIDEFEKNYSEHTPIWWYTRECFTYKMLNHSLRIVEIDTIAMMGFFMKDIHEQIKKIHSKRTDRMTTFTVYRGQGMLYDEFEKLRQNIGGLLAFNSFLSTSVDADAAKRFLRRRENQSNKVLILFHMEIDPTLTSTPFASLKNISCYSKEEEILFSMHTTFRIDSIEENHEHIWIIKLKSISDNDLQMTKLIEQIRREISGGSAVHRLCQLMITVGELQKAEELCDLLIDPTSISNEKESARTYNQLGYIKFKQGDHAKAKSYYQDACKIQEKLRPSTDLDLATTYSNMGLLYTSLNDSNNARLYHKRALDIREKLLDQNHPDLATTYNNIGLVCDQLQDYKSALSYYEKTLNIYKKSLLENHPWLATIYKNIGLAQISLGDRTTGLNHLLTAMDIRKKALPANHPSIASICSTIGGVYRQMGDYTTALKFYEQALDIEKRITPTNNHNLAMIYYDTSRIFDRLDQRDTAVKHAELAVELARKSLSSDHPDLILLKKNYEQLRTKH